MVCSSGIVAPGASQLTADRGRRLKVLVADQVEVADPGRSSPDPVTASDPRSAILCLSPSISVALAALPTSTRSADKCPQPADMGEHRGYRWLWWTAPCPNFAMIIGEHRQQPDVPSLIVVPVVSWVDRVLSVASPCVFSRHQLAELDVVVRRGWHR